MRFVRTTLSTMALSILLTACATPKVSLVRSAFAQRVLPERISIVQSDGPLPEFDPIATIEVPNNAYRSVNDAMHELRRTAAEIGGDALLDVTWGGKTSHYVFTPDSSGFATVSGTRIVGTIIRWRNPEEAAKALESKRIRGL